VEEKQYPEAVKKLNSLLKKYPFNPQALLILVQIQVEAMNNHRLALELIEEYFTQPNVTPAEENIEMLSICAGICENENLIPKVRGLLEYELKRKGYSDSDRKRLLSYLRTLDEKDGLEV
jgi:outer membrane protein assembly factor BamD (BamD/ComL family)